LSHLDTFTPLVIAKGWALKQSIFLFIRPLREFDNGGLVCFAALAMTLTSFAMTLMSSAIDESVIRGDKGAVCGDDGAFCNDVDAFRKTMCILRNDDFSRNFLSFQVWQRKFRT
jgi:hypothetical protein